MAKLTKPQRTVLSAIPDWSAPYEVRFRTGRDQTVWMLTRLTQLGLAEYSRANNTYRATEAGRAALAGKGEG